MKFTFITGNENKAHQVAAWLGVDVSHRKLDLDEIQTLDLHELIDHKVKQAYDILKQPVLVEDSQLSCPALGGLPGPFIKWFLDGPGPTGICRMLDSFDDRSAHNRLCFALYDGTQIRYFEGETHGSIAKAPRGNGGFGFDPIFIMDGHDITRAEMSEIAYAATSARKQALDKLKAFLVQ